MATISWQLHPLEREAAASACRRLGPAKRQRRRPGVRCRPVVGPESRREVTLTRRLPAWLVPVVGPRCWPGGRPPGSPRGAGPGERPPGSPRGAGPGAHDPPDPRTVQGARRGGPRALGAAGSDRPVKFDPAEARRLVGGFRSGSGSSGACVLPQGGLVLVYSTLREPAPRSLPQGSFCPLPGVVTVALGASIAGVG